MVKDYVQKVYAGFLGMNIGIRLGAPVEPTIWTYERIKNTYGDITKYVKEYINFAADDDANGPVYFLRSLYDKNPNRELTPGDVADAWLNYAREGLGMFWWGGYGRSTEHTAFLNLKAGIPAPQSGSIEQNGKTLAEQIGGQIFIDTWGLVHPCKPEEAAKYGEIAASVSHDGEGINGARFFCAVIAGAFEEKNPLRLVQIGLSQIPKNSAYALVSHAVMEFYHNHPDDWRACRLMLENEWGYDKYPGVCHIIPNAGVCILSLLYGGGDFARTVEIATMCGWDTDCNAGNVGTVMGVVCGLEGIPAKYREPINDFLVLSGISGYLNILDIPTYAKELALLGYKLSGENAPKVLIESFKPGEIYFDFALPGATHGIRLSDKFFCQMKHNSSPSGLKSGCLEILIDRMSRGDQCKVFYKPFYTRKNFSDERYSPVFSPIVYSGQTFRTRLYLDQYEGWETPGAVPYIHTCGSGMDILGGYIKLEKDQWVDIEYTIPDTCGDIIDEVGIILEGYSTVRAKTLGCVYMDNFCVNGKAEYTIEISKQRGEFGTVTPFSCDHGAWDIEDGRLISMRCEPAFAYTGNYYANDYQVSGKVTPLTGFSHLLLIRSKGALWGYGGGFTSEGKAAIYKNDKGCYTLAEIDFLWQFGREYELTIKAKGNQLTLEIDGEKLLTAVDDSFNYGMYGCGSMSMGRTAFGDLKVKEL